ncbi:MAG TPA: tRNA lysidine(34) synthetase TilS [Gemmatimonadaceae bacterium]
MSDHEVSLVQSAVFGALGSHEHVVLAVSGGIDSMVLLHAAVARLEQERFTVATFDHGTGPAAARAFASVAEECRDLGLTFIGGRTDRALQSEAELRDARWRFLRATASAKQATIATAHTESDQIETVLMRVLRDAGARGLAALYAPSEIVRPLIAVTRAQIAAYAEQCGVSWIEDPTNASSRYLRNRVRHNLLPALRTVCPTIEAELLTVARSAAAWRCDVEALLDASDTLTAFRDGLDVRAAAISSLSLDELMVVWPAFVARAGVTLDRRGTSRVAEFTRTARVGARIQLAGGWQVVRSRDAFELRALDASSPAAEALASDRRVNWGNWSFRPSSKPVRHAAMSAWLPGQGSLSVRAWRPGDSMAGRAGGRRRKVKELLSRAGITGHERKDWPVVLADDEIVWIPGVRLADAANAQSGPSGLLFVCEHHRR